MQVTKFKKLNLLKSDVDTDVWTHEIESFQASLSQTKLLSLSCPY